MSDKIVYLIFDPSKMKLKMILVYAPTSTFEDDEVEAFYERLIIALEEEDMKTTIIMGAVNAKIGQKNYNSELR